MKYILTPDEMRAVDGATIENYKIPSIVLMENASRSAANIIHRFITRQIPHFHGKIYALCGVGNNGGDGLAIARHLHENYQVSIIVLRDNKSFSTDAEINFQIASSLKIECIFLDTPEFINSLNFESSSIFLDALIGIGGSGELRQNTVQLLSQVRASRPSAIIAIDNPTGMNCLTGECDSSALDADLTIAMAAEKTGLRLGKGIEKCGKIETAFIGAPQSVIEHFASSARWEAGDNALQNRQRVSSKFDYGRVVVIAGSRSMPGAAVLAANAAVTSGAGLVELFTPERHASLLPEIICHRPQSWQNGFFSPDDLDEIAPSLAKADSIVLGPGIGLRAETQEFVRDIVEIAGNTPLIIDAEAIAAIGDAHLLPSMVLTPHIGEFARLTGISRDEIALNSLSIARKFASETRSILHLKHIPSLTTDGKFTYFAINGNPGMATAGSGDVLSGIIGAFAARAITPLQAASYGAFIHALSGDLCAKKIGFEALTASRIIEFLPEALHTAI